MKILLSAFSCDPSRGSESSNGWNWAYELARAGQEVWALTTPLGRTAIQACLLSAPMPSLNVVYIEPPWIPSWFGKFRALAQNFRWQWEALRRAKQLDSEIDFDIIHHVTWASLHVGSKLWHLRKPFVFGPVGGGQVADLRFIRYFRGGRMVEFVRSFLVRYFTAVLFAAKSTVSHSTLVLVTNEETRRCVTRLGATQIEFMLDVGISKSLLVDFAARPPQDPNKLTILWVGRLLPRKGVLLALQALSRIDPAVSFTCTIIGNGPQGLFLQRWIDQLGLGDRVNWRGQIPWDDVMTAYLMHDVFLFTSLRDTSGSQLIEAMARGNAMVTLDHQGARAVVPDDAGIRVPVTTPEETAEGLARALGSMATNPQALVNMARKAIEHAAEQTWDRKAARAIDLYRMLLDRNQGEPAF
jgi:glycosyltransferase involved in cell wall biosynthesis